MDDIEKLKAENSDLRTKLDKLEINKYCLEERLKKATETYERLLRILENLSNVYVKNERQLCSISKRNSQTAQEATCIAPRIP